MEFRSKSLAAALAGSLFTAAAPPLGPTEIENVIGSRTGAPGCAVAIVQDDRVVFEQGYGLADLDKNTPITPNTSFNIASMTKQFTGMAIALLIADGTLSEQDDIRKYLSELKDYGAPIRIANLLNHSSGLRNHMALAAFQPVDHLPSHDEALRLVFRQSAVNFVPGTRHQYESPNYVLLAEIVARVSGMSFPDFLAARILKPLGMSSSGYSAPGLAMSYSGSAEKGWTAQTRVNRAMGSSGLQSSVHDFAQFMINYDRQSVGGKQAFERMLSTSKLADGSPLSYRYGLVKDFDYAGVKGLTRISHGGQTAAYRSAFSWFPSRGFGDVVMCNYMADANAVDLAIVSRFVGGIKPPQPDTVGGSGTALAMRAELPSRFAGTWYSEEDDDVREFTVKDGSLALRYLGQELPLQWRGGTTFAIPDQGEFRFDGSRLEEAFDGQARLSFQKLADRPPTVPAPEEFAGSYRSKDVDGVVVIEPDETGLVLRYPAGEASIMRIGKDHFSNPAQDFNSVRFERGADGRVRGLSLTTSSGITRLRFVRVAK